MLCYRCLPPSVKYRCRLDARCASCAIYRCLLVTRAVLSVSAGKWRQRSHTFRTYAQSAPQMCALATLVFSSQSSAGETRFELSLGGPRINAYVTRQDPLLDDWERSLKEARMQSRRQTHKATTSIFTGSYDVASAFGLRKNACAKYQPITTNHGYHDGHRRRPQQQRKRQERNHPALQRARCAQEAGRRAVRHRL